ncbi:glycosyltransferase family 2 protein [Chitinophaga barathri]|nr:glycosyltransferase family 2 protein [Chitinophaga barathri]
MDKRPNIRLVIISACFNEQDGIGSFYRHVRQVIAPYDYQIIFVDDGSTDGTVQKIREICGEDNRVSYISLSRNFGQPIALKAGYDHAEGDCVICMDADQEHPPEIIEQLIAKWQEGYDVVNTIRVSDERVPLPKRFLSGLFYRLVNYMSDRKILMNGPDYRLLDIKVVQAIKRISESNPYLKELVPWLGFRQATVSFHAGRRQNGGSRYSFMKLFSLSVTGITSFSINPLRLSSLVGLFFSFLAFLYGGYALYVKIFTEETVPGWTSILASVLFISGLQLIMIGIIGEYLGKTFIEVKNRPQYIISDALIAARPLPVRPMEKADSTA